MQMKGRATHHLLEVASRMLPVLGEPQSRGLSGDIVSLSLCACPSAEAVWACRWGSHQAHRRP